MLQDATDSAQEKLGPINSMTSTTQPTLSCHYFMKIRLASNLTDPPTWITLFQGRQAAFGCFTFQPLNTHSTLPKVHQDDAFSALVFSTVSHYSLHDAQLLGINMH